MMTIRYLKDGVAQISDDTEVLAEGLTGYYIQGTDKYQFVPRELVVMKMYKNSQDEPPNIFEFAQNSNMEDVDKDIDWSLSQLFKTVH